MNRKFQRTIENFSCLNCGTEVVGDGYTNHCPSCLWSRHVDRQPGDRKAECKGMMMPVELEGQLAELRILHRCQLCGKEIWNQAAQDDDFDTLLALARERGEPG
jgi:hypothetical protein